MAPVYLLVVEIILRELTYDAFEFLIKLCVPCLQAGDTGCKARLGVAVGPIELEGFERLDITVLNFADFPA